MGRASWPESRTPPLIAPTLDAVGGRSFTQAIQTPGALGGRRGRETWHQDGAVPVSLDLIGHTAKVTGSPWRPVLFMARVEAAPNLDTMKCRVRMQAPPPDSSISDILDVLLSWNAFEFEGFGAVIKPGLVIPVGFTVYTELTQSSATAQGITVELDYRAKAVGQ